MFTDIVALVYIADILNNISGILFAVLLFLGFGLITSCILHMVQHSEENVGIYSRSELDSRIAKAVEEVENRFNKKYKKPMIMPVRFAIGFIVLGLFMAFIPSKQTVYMYAGAQLADRVAADPKVQQLGGKVYDLIEKKIDEELAKIEPKKEDPK